MANLQVKNVPDEIYDRLRHLASERNTTISATVLIAVERELRSAEWRKRLASRPPTDMKFDAAALIRKERAEASRE